MFYAEMPFETYFIRVQTAMVRPVSSRPRTCETLSHRVLAHMKTRMGIGS